MERIIVTSLLTDLRHNVKNEDTTPMALIEAREIHHRRRHG